MRKLLNEDAVSTAAGGNAYINANTMRITFDTITDVYDLKNCTASDADELCSSLIGQYSTTEEYDAACVEALRDKEWI